VNRIAVVGFPSRLGGADTELDHQIRCWQQLGLQVHLIPTGSLDANARAMQMDKRGCVVHAPREWSACRGMHVISYCNADFLQHLPAIKSHARSTIFVNCMCWLFDKEKEAHGKGLIDWFLYQTDHARLRVQKDLQAINPKYRWLKVRPYFYGEEFPFISQRPHDKFRFGRISRDDPGKYHPAQLWVYENMVAPVLKEGIILGFNETIAQKVGTPPNWIKCHPAGGIAARQVYEHASCVIQMSETYENLPRVGFEAMASGSLLIVDNRGGWQELIQHKQTGYLCNNQREFVYYASRAAFEREETRQLVQNARDWLNANWSLEQAKQDWTKFFHEIDRKS
jgi:glycosyltransferase involved in cell wall biosynthesis